MQVPIGHPIPNIGYNTENKQKVFATQIQMLRSNLGQKDAKKPVTLITNAYTIIIDQKSKAVFQRGTHTKIALKAITQEALNIADRSNNKIDLSAKKHILTTLNVLNDDYPNAFDARLIGELSLKLAENKNDLMEEKKINDAKKADLKKIVEKKQKEELEALERRLENLKKPKL